MIAHIDMDCFYASVEMAEDSSLRDIPIAISSNKRRSAIATCNYPARAFGVRSALGTKQALKRCPHLTVVTGRMHLYKEYSRKVFDLIAKRNVTLEKVSVDEAYLDLKGYTEEEALELCKDIRKDIEETLNITASIGISRIKFLAKICSDINKPDGMYILSKESEQDFIEQLPIGKFRGVGKKTEAKMVENKILSGKMLKETSYDKLAELFGKRRAKWFYNISRGIDLRVVDPSEKPRKSVSKSETFDKDISDNKFFGDKLTELSDKVSERLGYENVSGKTVTVKIKYANFTITTRSKTVDKPISKSEDIRRIAADLVLENPLQKKIRLLGVGVSNFEREVKGILW